MRTIFRLLSAIAIVSFCPEVSIRPASAIQPHAAFPPAMDAYLTNTARLTAAERGDLAAGKSVSKLLDADPSVEIAVFGAVWVAADPSEYTKKLMDIENFERGGPFLATKKISDPPVAGDFATLELPESDVKDLRDCKVGDCDLKLGTEGINAARAIDWKQPTAAGEARALVRRLALGLVTAYRDGGDDRLGVYRDKDRPTLVGKEFRAMVDGLPTFGTAMPDLKQYLLEYPRGRLANASDMFYWQLAQFGVKPTVRITHLVIQQEPDRTVVASKLLYASHYFWTALGLRVLLPDSSRGKGFWLINVSRCRSDGLSGFTGKFVRGRARTEAQKGVTAALTKTKATLEKS